MPLVDLYDDPAGAASALPLKSCDICIVGTGPAGATIAAELARSPLNVTILESGSFERREDADRLNDIESVGRRRVTDQFKVRNRIVGGSSYTWGGRVAPFDEIDFEKREWVPGSGWPLAREELAPYLSRSAEHLGLALGQDFSDERLWEIAPAARMENPPDPALLRPFYWQFSRDPQESYPYEYRRFGRGFVERLGPRQTLVTGATVTRVEPTADGSAVRAVVFAAPDGTTHELTADTVVCSVTGSTSIPVTYAASRYGSGIRAGNSPVPMPGSSTRPPRQPSFWTPAQIALMMNSGVKCAYWVQRASDA